jgi:hypothetical protein
MHVATFMKRKKSKAAGNPTVTEAREKLSADLGSLEF